MSSSNISEQEWHLEFHGIDYYINLMVSDTLLTLELENSQTSERWSGEFTAQYVEQITHKAGNLKKFAVFTTMLASSFSKSNESVFVDILTPSDLELLKAQKGVTKSTNSSISGADSNAKQNQKRYVVLSYNGEFDCVNYPLALSFEEQPNYPALKRNIVRLRQQLLEKAERDQEPANAREREMRQMISQLRQDNTELRHRLRHSSNNALNSSASSSLLNSSATASSMNVELIASNAKLRKQVETLKQEVAEYSQAYERLRTDSAKEVAKWKLKISESNNNENKVGGGVTWRSGPSLIAGDGKSNHNNGNTSELSTVLELRKRLAAIEKELRNERAVNSRYNSSNSNTRARWNSPNNNNSSSTNAVRGGSGYVSPRFLRNTPNSATASPSWNSRYNNALMTRRSMSPGIPPRGNSNASTNNNYYSRSSGSNGSSGNKSRYTADRGTSSRDSTPPLRQRPNSSSSTKRRGSVSPSMQPSTPPSPALQRQHHSASFSPSYSFSLGGRFDPTAYQRNKEDREIAARTGRAWGAGTADEEKARNRRRASNSSSSRYKNRGGGGAVASESGYTSANSQSTTGSHRSQRSNRSVSTQSQRSNASSNTNNSSHKSNNSDAEVGRKTKRKTNNKKKSKSERSGTATATDEIMNSTGSSRGVAMMSTTTAATMRRKSAVSDDYLDNNQNNSKVDKSRTNSQNNRNTLISASVLDLSYTSHKAERSSSRGGATAEEKDSEDDDSDDDGGSSRWDQQRRKSPSYNSSSSKYVNSSAAESNKAMRTSTARLSSEYLNYNNSENINENAKKSQLRSSNSDSYLNSKNNLKKNSSHDDRSDYEDKYTGNKGTTIEKKNEHNNIVASSSNSNNFNLRMSSTDSRDYDDSLIATASVDRLQRIKERIRDQQQQQQLSTREVTTTTSKSTVGMKNNGNSNTHTLNKRNEREGYDNNELMMRSSIESLASTATINSTAAAAVASIPGSSDNGVISEVRYNNNSIPISDSGGIRKSSDSIRSSSSSTTAAASQRMDNKISSSKEASNVLSSSLIESRKQQQQKGVTTSSLSNSSINNMRQSQQLQANDSSANNEEGDILHIDKRIQALQMYLDNARTGIASVGQQQHQDHR